MRGIQASGITTDPSSTIVDDNKIRARDILKGNQFFKIYLMMLCSVLYGYFIVNTFKLYGKSHFKDDTGISAIGAVANICGAMRFVWSIMMDYKSFK